MIVEFERRADLFDDAVPEDDDAVGQRHRFDLIVRDVDGRRAEITVQLGDLDPRLAAQRGVEVGERFVKQEDLRGAHDGAADGDALALAAGEFLRRALEVIIEVEDVGGAADFLFDDGRVGLGELQGKAHVLVHAHVRVQGVALEDHRQVALGGRFVGDVASFEVDGAGGRRLEAGDQAQQRRFAAARGADEDDELALLDFEIDALDDALFAEGFFDAAQLQISHEMSP